MEKLYELIDLNSMANFFLMIGAMLQFNQVMPKIQLRVYGFIFVVIAFILQSLGGPQDKFVTSSILTFVIMCTIVSIPFKYLEFIFKSISNFFRNDMQSEQTCNKTITQESFIDKETYIKMVITPQLLNTIELDRAKSALNHAMDVRKFEIELYWKRSTYFWTFISVFYGGYFYIIGKISDIIDKNNEFLVLHPDKLISHNSTLETLCISLLVIALLGMLCALTWYWINQSSKFWQKNWERQVDTLEDLVHGPLYKTIIYDTKEKALSVTKINLGLSLIVYGVSFVIAIYTVYLAFYNTSLMVSKITIVILSLILAIIFLVSLFPLRSSSELWKSMKRIMGFKKYDEKYYLRR